MKQLTSLADFHAIPDPDERKLTQVFRSGDYELEVTIWADGRTNAGRFYELTGALELGMGQCGALVPEKDRGLIVNQPNGKPIKITSPAYLGQLYILEAVAIQPAFSAAAWAIVGQKMGPIFLEEIMDWATEENGIGDFLRGKLTKLKNAISAEASKVPSSVPASRTSTGSRPNSKGHRPKTSGNSSSSTKRKPTS